MRLSNQPTPRARSRVLSALPSIFNFKPSMDYWVGFPLRSPADRMANAWKATGRQMQSAMATYAGRHPPVPSPIVKKAEMARG